MRRRILAVLIGLILVCGVASAKAQDIETTIYVYSDYASIDPQFVNDFFVYVKAPLEKEKINLELVDTEASSMAQVSILFFPEFDSERIIVGTRLEISFLQDPITQLSPSLFDTFSDVVHVSASPEISAQMATALIFYQAGRCDLAEPYFLEVQTDNWEITNPNYAHFYLGNCSLAKGDYEAAIGYFEQALYDYGGDIYGTTATNLAWSYLHDGREEDALNLVTGFIDNDRLSGRTDALIRDLTYRAQLYALAFRYDDALADMNAAIELDPTNPELYVMRGQLALYLYEWDRVLADYNRAIELDPDYADAYYFRGILFYTQGYREDALTDFQLYLDLALDGDHAADAAQYITDIQGELEALG
jgi:tetratricopeptide (TPR) repeat protein